MYPERRNVRFPLRPSVIKEECLVRKKLLSVFVILAIALSLVPVSVLAEEEGQESRVVALKDSNDNAGTISVQQGDDNTFTVNIDVDKITPTVSGTGHGSTDVLAYWVGVGIVAPSGAYDNVAFHDGNSSVFKDNGSLDEFVDKDGKNKQGFTIWLNAGNEKFKTDGTTYTLQWTKSGEEENVKEEVYHIKLGKVTSAIPTITSGVYAAPLLSDNLFEDYEAERNPGSNVITLSATSIKQHNRGSDGKLGYWIGVGFVPTVQGSGSLSEVNSVRYKTANTAESLDGKKYEELSQLEPDVHDGQSGIAVYVDAAEYVNGNQSLWIAINWPGSVEVFEVKFNVTLNIGIKTVTFDPNGGKVSPTSMETDGKGQLSKLPTPTRDGYDFEAWYTAKEGGYPVDQTYTFTKDTTVYAHWTKLGSGSGPNDSDDGQGGSGSGQGGSGGNTTNPGGGGGSGGSGNVGDEEDTYRIWLSSSQYGTVSATHTSAAPGTSVRLTVTPKSDYIVSRVRVRTDDGASLPLTQNGNRYTFTMPAADVTVDVSFSEIYSLFIPPQSQSQAAAQVSASAPSFTPVIWRPAAAMQDVPANSWSYTAAQWAYQNGYLDMAADGSFRLNGTVSHLQMWRIMARWLGEPAIDDSSVSQWASRSGAVRVGGASAAMTRQNVVEYLYQCYFLMGGDVSATGNLIQYRDSQQITSVSAKNAWIWAVNKGIISGTPDGYLNPGRSLSRGEFASILMRMCQG